MGLVRLVIHLLFLEQQPWGDGGSELQLCHSYIFFLKCCVTSLHIHSSLSHILPLFLSPISYLLSHTQVFLNILLHEFHISYSHTEWNLLSLLHKKWFWVLAECCKTKLTDLLCVSILFGHLSVRLQGLFSSLCLLLPISCSLS